MKSQRCHGFGRIAVPTGGQSYRLEFCQECNGSGVTSCCGDSMPQPPAKQEADE